MNSLLRLLKNRQHNHPSPKRADTPFVTSLGASTEQARAGTEQTRACQNHSLLVTIPNFHTRQTPLLVWEGELGVMSPHAKYL
jgi:hypothetical protein